MPSHRTGTPEDMDRVATFLEANPFASAMMIHQGPHGEQQAWQARHQGLRLLPRRRHLRIREHHRPLGTQQWRHTSTRRCRHHPQSPVYTRSADPEKKSGGEEFGQDLIAGIAEAFGFDGSLFKSPRQTSAW